MPSNHLILCHPPLLLPSIFPSIRVLSNESVLHIRWSNCWSFSFSISPSNNIQDRFPLGWTGWISLLSKGRSRVFSKKSYFLSEEINKYVIPSLTNVHKFDCQINIVEILCHLTLTLSRYPLINTNLTCFLENSISEHNTEMWRTLLSDAIVSKEGTGGIISGCPSYGSL